MAKFQEHDILQNKLCSHILSNNSEQFSYIVNMHLLVNAEINEVETTVELDVSVAKKPIKFLLDSGSAVSLINSKIHKRWN